MKKKVTHKPDGIDWIHYTVGCMVVQGRSARIRIGPVTESYARTLYEDTSVVLTGHMSTGKNKIVGYTLTVQQDVRFFDAGNGGLGVFFDIDGRNSKPELVVDEQSAKLHRFACGAVTNYALAVRT